MAKIKKIKIIFLLSTFFFLFSAYCASAQSLSLTSAKNSYNFGDSFSVSLSIDTGGKIVNTISGAINIPADKFQILETRYGNSIISLWVERPTINSGAGAITFAGGVPGGFGGSNGPILSFSLKAKKAGSGTASLEGIKVLLNDGLGTELKNISLKTLTLTIKEPPPAPKAEEKVLPKPEEEKPVEEVYLPLPDTTPPESFIPLVSRNQSVADNKYFVSFFAVDKDTGISRYEIMEKPLILSYITSKFDTPFLQGESPYVLKGQWWSYKVIVRVYDQAENYTDEDVIKPFHPVVLVIFALILVVSTFLITRFASRPRKHAKK
jgi:hypothetical protein